jgi:hypothetical protein
MVDKRALLNILRVLAQMVESASEEELEELRKGGLDSLRSPLTGRKPTKSVKLRSDAGRFPDTEIKELIEALGNSQTREDAYQVLHRRDLPKRLLEVLARRLDLPVLREDTSKRLLEKIVEASVGSRLGSEAIRGRLDR